MADQEKHGRRGHCALCQESERLAMDNQNERVKSPRREPSTQRQDNYNECTNKKAAFPIGTTKNQWQSMGGPKDH